ncbi:MAG TPA: hypothetical protein VMB49_13120 [Acidobacteriaceae bacterium]|nr:hypothetical protein [Acidobacteriaceae bacterium]
MEQDLGYFCRAYLGQDVQANVIARTLREAEAEITRMIRGGAMRAHAVQHGWPDHEPVLVASAYGGTADAEMWRYLRHNKGPEFDRWQTAYQSKTKILDERWVVIELSSSGITEYGAYGKAVRAIWGTATTVPEPLQNSAPHPESMAKGPTRANLIKGFTSKAG